MRIRYKTILIIVITLISLLGILYTASKLIIGRDFDRLEVRYMTQNVDRALSAIDNNLGELDRKLSDWAIWDDTYDFIQNPGEEYILSNLVDTTFINLNINLIMFINQSGEVIYQKYYDLKDDCEKPFPEDARDYIVNSRLTGKQNSRDGVKGIALLKGGPMMLASQPILDSMSELPSKGRLIMGRYLDGSQLDYLRGLTKLPIDLFMITDGGALPNDAAYAFKNSSQNENISVQVLNDQTLAGYSLIRDVDGKPVLILKVNYERDIHNQGEAGIAFFSVALLAAGIIFCVLILLLLDKLVIERLTSLSRKLGLIGSSGDISARVEASGGDELGELGREINSMLDKLQRYQTGLIQAKDAAEAASLSKGQFLANMSHEIRTPLNAIIGISSMLEEMPLDDKQKKLVAALHNSGDLLLNIINDVLDISKMEAGKLKLNIYDFDLRAVIESVCELVSYKVSEKKLFLNISIDPRIQLLKGDADRLGQIILNLLGNAVKFTEKGGVSLTASRKSSTNERITVRFEVGDTGIGMEKATLKKLFQPYVQAEAASNRKYGGTGLGLSICRQLVDMMGGEIGVSSKLGEGTTFWFEVAFLKTSGLTGQLSAADAEEEAASANEEADRSKSEIKILIAEDNPLNREIAAIQLQKLGYDVITAVNGRDALDKLLAADVSLAFMDCQMPDMDGLECVRKLREAEAARGGHVPVIAMTASSLKGDYEKCISAGMDDYISKPVKPARILEVLDCWLNGEKASKISISHKS